MPAQITCPRCSQALAVAAGLRPGRRLRCPRCQAAFAIGPAPARRAVWLWAAGAVLLLVLACGVALAVMLNRPPPPSRHADAAPTAAASSAPRDEPPVTPPPPEPPSGLTPDQEAAVRRAIDRGVAFLRKTQAEDGSWSFNPSCTVGPTALAGLALLECGVAAADEAVAKAAALVRGKARAVQGGTATYEVSLAILFLDRLGDPADEGIIQSMALRLTAGQQAGGGWAYNCPLLTPEDEAKLLQALRDSRPASRAELADGGEGARQALAALPPALKGLPALSPPPGDQAFAPHNNAPDNSNTQFAVLGLWTARRHGVPTERVLALVERRFRATQHDDGGWGYGWTQANTDTPAMTAAGLLALAVGHGLAADLSADGPTRPAEDPAVEKAMKALARSVAVDGKVGDLTASRAPAWNTYGPAGVRSLDLYYLWSVERVGVLYGRAAIGGKEWYPWGVRLLTKSQGDDGGWGMGASGLGSPAVDACFALLFLKRADLARDLSTRVRFLTPVKP